MKGSKITFFVTTQVGFITIWGYRGEENWIFAKNPIFLSPKPPPRAAAGGADWVLRVKSGLTTTFHPQTPTKLPE